MGYCWAEKILKQINNTKKMNSISIALGAAISLTTPLSQAMPTASAPVTASTTPPAPIFINQRVTAPLAANTLPASIQAKLAEANLSSDAVSIMVQPLSTAQKSLKPLIAYHGETPRMPASTQKLIPTFVALDRLGKDFRWQTSIYQHGIVYQGKLYGDIIIQGSGDPSLDAVRLSQLLAQLKAKGINAIDGNVIIDHDIFKNVNFNPNSFDGKGYRPYNAPPNGLLVNFGTLEIALSPIPQIAEPPANNLVSIPAKVPDADAAAGEAETPAPTVSIDPNKVQNFAVKLMPKLANFTAPSQIKANHLPCRASGDSPIVTLTAQQLSFSQTPSANCAAQTLWITYPDSNKLVINAISAYWHELYPNFHGQIIDKANQQAISTKWPLWTALTRPKLIASTQSAPLGEQISTINHFSNNVMTEQVTLSLPVYADHQAYSDYPSALGYIRHWWQQHLPNHKAPVMSRGSGLCRDCQVMPNSMLALLNYAYHSPNFNTYRVSLPLAGVSGTMKTLKARQPTNPAIGHAWIKTGTLDDVNSMAGYIQGQSGRWYAVVGMINAPGVVHNPKAKAVLDEMLAWTAVQ